VNHYARKQWLLVQVQQPFLSAYAVSRPRSHGFRNQFIPCALCSGTAGCSTRQRPLDERSTNIPALPSPQKPNQKPIPNHSRFREWFINCSLLATAAWFIHVDSKPKPFQQIHWTTRIGQTVIFDAWVTPYTPVEMTIWEGDFFTRTQKQVLTNVRSMNQMRQTPKDQFGWVW